MTNFYQTSKEAFARPAATTEMIPFPSADFPHAATKQSFVNSALEGETFLSPGKEGLCSIELANAITYSSPTSQTVELPSDGSAWEHQLNQLISASRRI